MSGSDTQSQNNQDQRWFQELFTEPAIITGLVYIIITIIGFTDSIVFYKQFQVDILEFSELSDFLLAAFRNQRSLMYFGLSLLYFAIIAIFFGNRFNRAQPLIQATLLSRYLTILLIWVIYPIGALALGGYIVSLNAKSDALSIRVGDANQIHLELRDEVDQIKFVSTEQPRIAFLGATKKFSFFYDYDEGKTVIVPVENIESMTVSSIKISELTNQTCLQTLGSVGISGLSEATVINQKCCAVSSPHGP